MIGDDCPSFPSYQAAFRAFFYRDFAGTPGQVPSSFGVVRVVDSRAWLDKVRITPAALEVHVAGGDMTGARVELNSATHRTDARLTETGQVSLPFRTGFRPGRGCTCRGNGSGSTSGRSASTGQQATWRAPGWMSRSRKILNQRSRRCSLKGKACRSSSSGSFPRTLMSPRGP